MQTPPDGRRGAAVTVAAVVLAAGAGRRFRDDPAATPAGAGAANDGHKLLAPFRGRPLVTWALDAARGGNLDETIVVTGAVALDGLVPDDVTVVHNDHWDRGMATSLGCAVAYAERHGHDAIVVGLGDSPLVEPAAWAAVAAETSAPIAVATYDGERRSPVRLHRDVWPLLPADGDEGARGLIRRRPDLVREVPCPGSSADIDTREDVERWS